MSLGRHSTANTDPLEARFQFKIHFLHSSKILVKLIQFSSNSYYVTEHLVCQWQLKAQLANFAAGKCLGLPRFLEIGVNCCAFEMKPTSPLRLSIICRSKNSQESYEKRKKSQLLKIPTNC